MRRRNFVAFLGIAMAVWQFGGRAQQQCTKPTATSKEGPSLNRSISMPGNGLESVQSRFATRETTARLLSALAQRKLSVFACVDHAAGARSIHRFEKAC